MSCHTPVLEPVEATTPTLPGTRSRLRTVALIGPPNSGKSTLFNRLTGLRQKVANYPGVTVEHHSGRMKSIGRNDLTLIDLPGIYSLATYSEDARVAVDVLTGKMSGVPKPDCVLLVLDATHLNRQLMLAAPVFSIGLPTLVLLNMSDQMDARGGNLDTLALARELGHPVALISAAQGKGLDVIPDFLLQADSTLASTLRPVQLPVLQSPASCRTWATQVTARTSYKSPAASLWTRRLDSVLLHRVAGPAIFLAVVFAVFQVVFTLGQPLSDGLGNILTRAGEHAALLLPDNWLRLLLRDGLWNGVQSVLVFLPQILLLFLFIGRLATILIAPFMTCSARLPIYTLIIAAFIPNRMFAGGIVGLRALVMLSLYALGFLAALITAKLLNSSVMKASTAPFILELPQYRWPTAQSLMLRLYDRGKLFLKKAGTVILGVTFLVWLLGVVPVHFAGNTVSMSDLTNSVIGHIGRFIEPVLRPLGFNWKIGIGLLSSIVAREVIVGTLGTLYGVDPTTHSLGLQAALRHDMTLGGAIALVVFFAFAMQCTSTLAVVRRETNSWKFPAMQFTYMTVVAYVAALLTNQLIIHLF
jgi:ferrous iron transport protein B